MTDRDAAAHVLTKVPAVTLGFWIVKVLATTLGETGGDTVTMSWLGETTPHPVPGGYLIGTAITGLGLLMMRESMFMGTWLALHLGFVLAFFLTMPYGKFVHGLYRLAALVRFHLERRRPLPDFAAE